MPEKKINDSSDEAELVLDQMLDQDVVVRRAAAAAAPAKAAALGNGTAAAAAHALTLREIRREPRVRVYIAKANEQMASIGYTEHGHRHAGIVATIARSILQALDRGERIAELAAIAGYLHDMGCVINRAGHVEAGALMAFRILSDLRVHPLEIADIIGAIGNHEEPHGLPISPVAAAVIIADKSDVHFTRVQNPDPAQYDIHDKVNAAVRKSYLRADPVDRVIRLELEIDTEAASVMEYFEIFILRMVMCRKSAEVLGCRFRLSINGRDV
jgi:metal-dependent HD superfamily phosphatase/phosphodiesterase